MTARNLLTQAETHPFGVMDALVMIALPWGLAWVLRYARMDGRDPARALRSLLVYASTPADGRLSGRPQHHSRPRLAGATCTVHVRTALPAKPAPVAMPIRSAAPAKPVRRPVRPAPLPQPAPAVVVPAAGARPRPAAKSGLQALLASLDER